MHLNSVTASGVNLSAQGTQGYLVAGPETGSNDDLVVKYVDLNDDKENN